MFDYIKEKAYKSCVYLYDYYYIQITADFTIDLLLSSKIYIQQLINHHYNNDETYKITSLLLHDINSKHDIHDIDINRYVNNDFIWTHKNYNLNFNNYIELSYQYKDNKYKIIYGFKETITFPIYTKNEIENYRNSDVYKNEILLAIDNKNNDYTNLIKQYTGPLNNFYDDKNIIGIYIKYIKDISCDRCINSLNITDSYLNNHEFKLDDKLFIKHTFRGEDH
jgi:hypothetical protein